MYSIPDYASMMADTVRMTAYADALRRTVRPDSIVLDLGAGIGAFGLLARQMGARKVYAIEPDDAIHLARDIAAASGLADGVEFVQASSTDVVLPERADVIVSDIRGVLPLFGRHIPSIVDARTRLLAPSGVLIPRRDRLWAAVVEAPDLYETHVTPWRERSYGLELQPVREMLANTWRKVRLRPNQLLSASQRLGVLDYRELTDSNLDIEGVWVAQRAGTGHGLSVWFDTDLTEDDGLSNAPGESAAIYGQAFFPFAVPPHLGAGEAISVRLRANLVGDDYVWQWTVSSRSDSGDVAAQISSQSTLDGAPLGPVRLRKSESTHVATLTTDGEISLAALSLMRAAMPLGEIADQLISRFPGALRDWNAALGRVGELSRKYSKD